MKYVHIEVVTYALTLHTVCVKLRRLSLAECCPNFYKVLTFLGLNSTCKLSSQRSVVLPDFSKVQLHIREFLIRFTGYSY